MKTFLTQNKNNKAKSNISNKSDKCFVERRCTNDETIAEVRTESKMENRNNRSMWTMVMTRMMMMMVRMR